MLFAADIGAALGAMILLVSLSAVFSAAETAFFSLGRVPLSRLRTLRASGARLLLRLLRRPRDTLIGILLGNEVLNASIAVVGAHLINQLMGNSGWASVVSVLIVTPLVLVCGEILPKNLALTFSEKLAPRLAPPVHAFLWITKPVRILLTAMADGIVRLFGADPRYARSMIVEEEFRALVDIGEESGEISKPERAWIHGLFHASDASVAKIMTPAARMFRMPINWSIKQMRIEMRAAQFSRVPIYEDDPNNVLGLVYLRDLVRLTESEDVKATRAALRALLRPVPRLAPDTTIEAALRTFQETSIHMAIVQSKSDEVVGLVTMDDVMIALLGQLPEAHA